MLPGLLTATARLSQFKWDLKSQSTAVFPFMFFDAQATLTSSSDLFTDLHCAGEDDATFFGMPYVEEGGVVYRQKERGEEARGFTTVRGAPQNGDGRTCVRQAEPQKILCYAMRVSDLGSLFVFFEGSG